MVLLLAACLFARTGVPRWRDLRRPPVLEMLALALLFVATYFALPIGYAEAYYVDTRPLPLASFFFIAACLALPRPDPVTRPGRERLAFALAALLAIGNLAYLARHFIAQSAWIAQYRNVVAAIPAHGRVLPVYTHGGDGSVVRIRGRQWQPDEVLPLRSPPIRSGGSLVRRNSTPEARLGQRRTRLRLCPYHETIRSEGARHPGHANGG
jgi:hypothetical protein